MKTYKILAGSFRMPDNSLRQAGETVDLDEDVATAHRHLLEEVAETPEASTASSGEQPTAEA